MKKKKLLLIFVKNPEKGKVKTRLANTVGDDRAYKIYLRLLKYTIKIAGKVDAKRQIWYSSYIDYEDGYGKNPSKYPMLSVDSSSDFQKKLQKGEHLGQRMFNAFQNGFDEGFNKIVIIGSDCPGITSEIIEDAFSWLDRTDVVVGPSEDGGYYLLGLNNMIPGIFKGISWSTEKVFSETLNVLENHEKDYKLLQILNDIDTEEDLQNSDFE